MSKKKMEFLDDFKKQMAFDEPNMRVTDVSITKQNFIPEIKMHLDNDEILLLGLVGDIGKIENYAFKPDTPDNEGLEMIFIHEPFTNAIFFAKKSLLFATYLQDVYGLTTAEISSLQMMWFLKGEANFDSEWTPEQMYDLMNTWLRVTQGLEKW
jgi:hypothetical protein